MTSPRRARIFALIACLGFGLGGPLRAETLTGRLFLGPGLGLHLEKDEGLFTEMLRALSLVDSEVPVVNLKALAIRRDHLFLGETGELFLRHAEDDGPGEVVSIGRWKSAGQVSLDSGVQLESFRTAQEIFEGGARDALHVRLSSGIGTPADEPVEAKLDFWLTYLSERYYPDSMSERDHEESSILLQAMVGSLPQSPEPSAEAGENLKRLKRWVEENPYENPEGTYVLLETMVTRLRNSLLHLDVDQDADTLESLLDFYEGQREILEDRRE